MSTRRAAVTERRSRSSLQTPQEEPQRRRNRRMVIQNRTFFFMWACSLVAALITVRNERMREIFYNLAYLLAAIIVLSFMWTLVNIRWVQLSRQTRAKRSQVGKPVEEKFSLQNRSWFPKLWLEIRDHSDLPNHLASQVLNAVGPGKWRDWPVRTTCRQRGLFKLGPMTISTGDPFGLFHATTYLDQTSPIIVYPATVELRAFSPPIGRLTGGDAVRRRTHHITTNVSGVRDYAYGDSFSRIHWPSTARKDRLIVKEFELDPTADIWLFVDMQREVQIGQRRKGDELLVELPALFQPRPRKMLLDPTTEEYAVTATASLAQHFIRQNRAVGLAAYAQSREILPADRGQRQLTKILEALAVLRAYGSVSLAQVLATESDRLVRGTTVVIITPSPDDRWVIITRDLAQRGLRSIAVLVDPSSFGSALTVDKPLQLLRAIGTPTYVVRCDEPLEASLSVPV